MELHYVTPQGAAEKLGTDPQRGLSPGEVQKRQEKFGKNQLQEGRKRGVLLRFLGQFQDLMVLILLASAAVSYGVSRLRGDGEFVDSIIILAIVVVNAVIGTVQSH